MLAVGWYSAKRGTGVVAKQVEARLGKPSLVRETSRLTLFELFKHPIASVRTLFRAREDPLKGIVLNVSAQIIYRALWRDLPPPPHGQCLSMLSDPHFSIFKS